MTLSRSPIKPARTGKPRRSRHPMPLPPADGSPTTLHGDEGDARAFGVQAELCRGTVCCACFSQWWRRVHGPLPIDWTQLPEVVGGQRSDPHHEPPRGTAVASDDDDTIPLCRHHHTDGFVARHAPSWSAWGGKAFFGHLKIHWPDVRDEMRRRVALTKPVPATASETP